MASMAAKLAVKRVKLEARVTCIPGKAKDKVRDRVFRLVVEKGRPAVDLTSIP